MFPVKSSERPFIQDWDAGFWMWIFKVTHLFLRSAHEQQINSSLIWSLSYTSTQKNPADLVISFIQTFSSFLGRTRTQFILYIPPFATGLSLVSIITCLTQCVVYHWIVLWHQTSWSCTSVENRLQACGRGVQMLTGPGFYRFYTYMCHTK